MMVHDDWLLTPERAAVHLPTATAVVADLHLGYNEARRRNGDAVPMAGVDEALGPLLPVLERHGLKRLVVAGDLFEERWDPELAADFLRRLTAAGVEVAGVVPGNHDRAIKEQSDPLPIYPRGLDLGRWRVVHGDGRLPRGLLVHGHFHPWLRWGRVSTPCYLVGERRLILPAFSRDARGVDVTGQRAWRRYRCCAVAGAEVLDLGPLERFAANTNG
jgi:putative SbcD/Mre11-related phosphoesterase